MKKGLFQELYLRSWDVVLRDFPSGSLSGLLHGYLQVYTLVRLYPWLESDFGTPSKIHERVKEIGCLLEVLSLDKDLPVDTRAGHAADLMDVYQLYSDRLFLQTGLDLAGEILYPGESSRLVLPCRTPNICRLLCDYHYFTGDAACAVEASGLVTEIVGYSRVEGRVDLLSWWEALIEYDNVFGLLREDVDRLSLLVRRREEETLERFQQTGGDDPVLSSTVFHILACREFAALNEGQGSKA